jgi:hypothetical protein
MQTNIPPLNAPFKVSVTHASGMVTDALFEDVNLRAIVSNSGQLHIGEISGTLNGDRLNVLTIYAAGAWSSIRKI